MFGLGAVDLVTALRQRTVEVLDAMHRKRPDLTGAELEVQLVAD